MSEFKDHSEQDAPQSGKSVSIVLPAVTLILSITLLLSIVGNVVMGRYLWNSYTSYAAFEGEYDIYEDELNQESESETPPVSNLEDERAKLHDEIAQLTEANRKLTNDYNDLKHDFNVDRIPLGYYAKVPLREKESLNQLKDFLNYEFAMPKDFNGLRENIFDCSEMAAYLEWTLEKSGFDARIATGSTPWQKEGHHAWVLVYINKDLVAIEPTALVSKQEELHENISSLLDSTAKGIIIKDMKNDTSKNYYDSYSQIFYSVEEAIDYDEDYRDWNWWEGIWGFE